MAEAAEAAEAVVRPEAEAAEVAEVAAVPRVPKRLRPQQLSPNSGRPMQTAYGVSSIRAR